MVSVHIQYIGEASSDAVYVPFGRPRKEPLPLYSASLMLAVSPFDERSTSEVVPLQPCPTACIAPLYHCNLIVGLDFSSNQAELCNDSPMHGIRSIPCVSRVFVSHESKPAHLARLLVQRQVYIIDVTILAKILTDLLFISLKGQTTNEYFAAFGIITPITHWFLSVPEMSIAGLRRVYSA